MRIEFEVADEPSWFTWDYMTGKAELGICDKVVPLQNPLNPLTHVSFTLKRTWRHTHDGHQVEVVKRRPLFFAGFRPNTFTISVDGESVAQAKGM